jgi:hypothetical protein
MAALTDCTVQFDSAIDDTVTTHREQGDPNQLADAIEAIRGHISESVAATPRSDH